MTLRRTDDGNGAQSQAQSQSELQSESQLSTKSEAVALGRITLKRKDGRGRPRQPAINPTDALTLDAARAKQVRSSRGGSGNARSKPRIRELPIEGVDTYLDHDYLVEEQRLRYRAEDFHIAIKNEQDHEGVSVKVRQHPVMEAALNEMVGCGEFPISSVQDIYRVGAFQLMRKLYHLRQAGPKLTNWMAQLKAQSDLMSMHEESMNFQKTLERLRGDVDRMVKEFGEFGKQQAAVLVVGVRNGAKAMRDRAWGEWYLERIEEEFGELVRSQEKRVRIKRGGE